MAAIAETKAVDLLRDGGAARFGVRRCNLATRKRGRADRGSMQRPRNVDLANGQNTVEGYTAESASGTCIEVGKAMMYR